MEQELTSTDPVANTREPFGVGRGFGINEYTGLLTAIAEWSECVVPVTARTALPIAFSSFPHSSSSTPPPPSSLCSYWFSRGFFASRFFFLTIFWCFRLPKDAVRAGPTRTQFLGQLTDSCDAWNPISESPVDMGKFTRDFRPNDY